MRNEDKTWAKGVLYGIGHGGFEAAVFVGGLGLLTVINLIALPLVNPTAQLTQQLTLPHNKSPALTRCPCGSIAERVGTHLGDVFPYRHVGHSFAMFYTQQKHLAAGLPLGCIPC